MNHHNETDDDDKYISSKRKRRMQLRLNGGLQHYKNSIKNVLTTTRFNNKTWNENIEYRKRYPNIGCIYATPVSNSTQIADDAIVFVLEMNNDTNKIIGIGMVRNHVHIKKYRVYSNDNYNRYAYIGKYRIDRTQMSEQEEDIMKVFDILCFTGPRHMKRLQGMRQFPIDMLYRCSKILDLNQFISQMFKTRISK